MKRFFGLFDPAGTKKYITQITLILVSLFIATTADRYREAAKNKEKLQEYLVAIKADLKEEIRVNRMNLHDCRNDCKSLYHYMHLAALPQLDSQLMALQYFAEVYWRGVFRAFPPLTYELMQESGEVRLIKDLELQNALSSICAFRRNVIQNDLNQYDLETQRCAQKLGDNIHLSGLLYGEKPDASCIINKTAFAKSPHNEILLLLRCAELRGFHLENALEDLVVVDSLLSNHAF
jgi:hypothetical protein